MATVPAVEVAELAEARLQQVRDGQPRDIVAGVGRNASARGAALVSLALVLVEPDGPVRRRLRIARSSHSTRARPVPTSSQPERSDSRMARPPDHRRVSQGAPALFPNTQSSRAHVDVAFTCVCPVVNS